MKKTIILLFALCWIIGAKSHNVYAASEKSELKTTEATLTIDQKGNLKVVQNKGQIVQINAPINNLWKIILKNNLTNKEYQFIPDKNFTIDRNENTYRLNVNAFSVENKTLPVKAEFTISVKDDAFCFSGSLKSNSGEWMLKELEYPCLPGIFSNNKNISIYWPQGLGTYFNDPEVFGSRNLWYPSAMGGAMQWFSVNSQDAGIYIGSHDPLQATKVLNLSYTKPDKTFTASITSPIYGNDFQIPDIMVKSYKGKWYNASKYYRGWYDKHFKTFKSADWVIDDSGWLLAILKQQNMEVMWPYKDIDKLCDIAEQFNLSTIGLFGWAVGGHDHLYPNFPPDNLMGGRIELKKAIERAHKRGIKIILYANGKIMDTSTDYYLYNGIETIVLKGNKEPDIQYYVKQKNSTPVIFAQACTGSEVWRRTMFDLGLQAVSLGADGILYDQLGVMLPELCFSKNHDHYPGEGDAMYRLQMIREISQNMKAINPGFIVMTEATNDAIIREIDYFHGWGLGTAESQNAFPELFRYTFPELMSTQRNPNPMITRTEANFAAIYGLRHEIESRYPGDVEYMLHGTLPTANSYFNVAGPPSLLAEMSLVPADVVTKYVHLLIEFEKMNQDFLRHGKFIDQEGIEITGNDIVAKGFLSGNRMGVVVWNKNVGAANAFSVSVPGYQLKNASEPGKEKSEAYSPLNANSIRLLVFEKKEK